jgi:hypothetical protein
LASSFPALLDRFSILTITAWGRGLKAQKNWGWYGHCGRNKSPGGLAPRKQNNNSCRRTPF